MTRAFKGGSKIYENMGVPQTETDVLNILSRFVRDNFNSGNDIATEIAEDQDRYLIFFADDDEQTSPATLGNRDDELIAYGAFSYLAKDPSVQTIWENRFEIRNSSTGVYVRVSDWYGTTVESWNKKVQRKELYV